MIRQFFASLDTYKPLAGKSKLLLVLAIVLAALLLYLSYLIAIPAMAKAPAVAIRSWQSTTPLPIALAGRNTVVHGNRLYVIGGKKADNTASLDIYSAVIDSTGEIGGWEIVGQLPMDYYLFTSVVANDALFLIGGWNGANTVNNVWRATFLSDGHVDNWAVMPSLPVAVDLHDTALIDGYIYSVGGWNGTQPQQGIYAAAVTANGLSSWQLVGNLPHPLYRHTVAGAQGYLYVTGGYDQDETAEATVLAVKVNGANSLGGWQTPPALPMASYYHALVIHDKRLVMLGGRNDNTFFNSVYSSAIGADGLPGTWQAEPTLPQPLHRFGAAVLARNGSDYIIVAGGLRDDNNYQVAVYHSDIPQPPTATPTPTFTPTPTPTPTPTDALTVFLDHSPSTWVKPGDQVTYTIRYRNDGVNPVNDVSVSNAIPSGVSLVPDSIRAPNGNYTVGGTQSAIVINWEVGAVAPHTRGEVGYAVERPVPPTPAIPLALGVTVDAPTEVTANEEITYRFTITNRAPIALNGLIVTDT
ncbi:MAG: DUF11 domain-containing protein, partial [Caldilineaceae bacterium]|nr:DUF11 domain-containing protein [Caldilineaceae bacterium]